MLLPLAFSLGAAIGIAVHNTRSVLRLRGDAPTERVLLDHDTVIGEGATGDHELTLVILGDSAADGYGLEDPDDAFPRQIAHGVADGLSRTVSLTSFAEDGARTADVTDWQVDQLENTETEVVVVSIGVNDALNPVGRVREVRTETAALLAAVRYVVPGATVVLVGCPDLSSAPGFPWPLASIVGRRCRAVRRAQREAAERSRVPFVDLGGPVAPHLYGADGFHPGAAGQAAMAAATADRVLATLKGPSRGS